MRQYLEGYKGSIRKYMAPVSESVFNADVMEFKDDEYIAFSVGLGMVDVLCKRMIEDIMENKNDRE